MCEVLVGRCLAALGNNCKPLAGNEAVETTIYRNSED